MSLVPLPSEQPQDQCAGCGAALAADQRYCLTCGRPCSPVRLAFLDVLQSESPARGPASPLVLAPQTLDVGPDGRVSLPAGGGWLSRQAGLLGLLSVLGICLLVGLLVGHWVTQGRSAPNAPQVIKVEGLGALGAAAPAGTSSSTPGAGGSESSSAKEEAQAAKEAAKETKAEKAPPPKPVKVTPSKLQKLSTSTGKRHQEEINSLGAQPIETG